MPNYIVTFKIHDEKARESLRCFLEGLGLCEKENAADTLFGLYENNTEKFVKILRDKKGKWVTEENDIITVYSAGINRNNYPTILTTTI